MSLRWSCSVQAENSYHFNVVSSHTHTHTEHLRLSVQAEVKCVCSGVLGSLGCETCSVFSTEQNPV